MTIEQLLDRWEKDILRHRVAPTTYDNYKSLADSHIVPSLGRKRVAKLTPAEVDGLISEKLDSGLSSSTVSRIRNVLSQAIDQAVRWGIVGRNIVTLSRLPKGVRTTSRALTPEQAKRFLKAIRGDRLEGLWVTMLYLGLRPGEVRGLAWDAVDLKGGVLVVKQAAIGSGKNTSIGLVKTATSRRSVNLPAPVIAALRHQKKRQAEERLAAGSSWTDLGLVFPNEVGKPIDSSNLRRDFAAACDKAGLGHWHPHELRHSAASLMLEQQVPIEVVSDVLGHSTIRMTADVYGHIRSPQRQLAAEAMTEVLS
jgi:integrase